MGDEGCRLCLQRAGAGSCISMESAYKDLLSVFSSIHLKIYRLNVKLLSLSFKEFLCVFGGGISRQGFFV